VEERWRRLKKAVIGNPSAGKSDHGKSAFLFFLTGAVYGALTFMWWELAFTRF